MTDKLNSDQMEALQQALASGQKVQAIKIYRQATGEGLKEAKEYLDALTPRLVEQDPERYARLASAQNRGCLSILFVLVTTLGGLGLMIAMAIVR